MRLVELGEGIVGGRIELDNGNRVGSVRELERYVEGIFECVECCVGGIVV